MRILNIAKAIPVARLLLPALGQTDNEARKTIKSVARDLVNATMESLDKSGYQNCVGMSVNRSLDMLHRNALADICHGILMSAYHGVSSHQVDAIDRLTEAMRDDSKCHPKERGSGKSRGYHLKCTSAPKISDDIADLVNSNNTPTHGANMQLDTAINVVLVAADIVRESRNEPTITHNIVKRMAELFSDRVEKLTESEMQAVCAGVDLHIQSGNPIPDHEAMPSSEGRAVENIISALTGDPEPTPEQTKSTPAVSQGVSIDASLLPAVNALLGQATKGKVSDINTLIDEMVSSKTAVLDLQAEIERLRNAAPVFAPVAQSGTVTVDASTLTYEVKHVRANTLFPKPDGSLAKELDFDVATLVWKDDQGNVVQHPDCPDVDPAYQFRLRHLIKFMSAIQFGQNIWLHGHTGTGKTTLAEQIAARIGFPIERLNLDSNLERADIVGGVEITVDGGAPKTKFREGILPRAMQQPCIFVLDEIDAGRPDVLFVIQRALERKGLTLTEDGGRTVKPHELFRFVATANSRGQGDEHGWYQGVRPMNLAMLNRFGAFIEVPYLDQDDEERLLSKSYPALSGGQVKEMAQFATEIRNAFTGGEISQTMSPRNLHAMAMYFLHFKPLMGDKRAMEEAVQTTVTDAAPADCTQRILEISSRVFA